MPSDPRAELEAWRRYSDKSGFLRLDYQGLLAAELCGIYERAARIELEKQGYVRVSGPLRDSRSDDVSYEVAVYSQDGYGWGDPILAKVTGPTLAHAFTAALMEAGK